MAHVGITSAALRIFGDDLDPDEISLALGIEPTRWARKGELETTSPRKKPAKIGFWQLNSDYREPGNLDAQIQELFSMVSSDLDVWRNLTERFHADIFCGLFMNETNEGGSLERNTLEAMAHRRIALEFDIYGPSSD